MREATSGIDYTSRDYEAFRQDMISQLSVRMPEYTDRSQTDAGIAIIELLARCLDILSYYADVIANETLLPTCRRLDSADIWCQIMSYIPRTATPSKVMQVFELVSTLTEDYVIPKGTYIKTKGSAAEQEVIFETDADLVIPAGATGIEKDENGNYLYQVSATQGTHVYAEYLTSNASGNINQEYTLAYSPAIVSSVEIYIDEGSGFELWVRKDNFIESGPVSKNYVVRVNSSNEAVIVFGDNSTGKAPVEGATIACNYRVGGGTQGNVAAEKVNTMQTEIAQVKATFNPAEIYVEGFDRETLDEIKQNIAIQGEVKWGALTLNDFAEVVKLYFPEIVLSKAARDENDIDAIHIYITTTKGLTISDDLMASLTEFFDENKGGRKIVGASTVYIEPAVEHKVDFTTYTLVRDRYSRAEVTANIKAYIESYLAVNSYPMGESLSVSELAANVMQNVPGIRAFWFKTPTDTLIEAEDNEIITINSLDVSDCEGGDE